MPTGRAQHGLLFCGGTVFDNVQSCQLRAGFLIGLEIFSGTGYGEAKSIRNKKIKRESCMKSQRLKGGCSNESTQTRRDARGTSE